MRRAACAKHSGDHWPARPLIDLIPLAVVIAIIAVPVVIPLVIVRISAAIPLPIAVIITLPLRNGERFAGPDTLGESGSPSSTLDHDPTGYQ